MEIECLNNDAHYALIQGLDIAVPQRVRLAINTDGPFVESGLYLFEHFLEVLIFLIEHNDAYLGVTPSCV